MIIVTAFSSLSDLTLVHAHPCSASVSSDSKHFLIRQIRRMATRCRYRAALSWWRKQHTICKLHFILWLYSWWLYSGLIATDLTRLLPVGAVGDVKKDFEDLYDTLRGVQWDGWCCRVQHTFILVLPLDLQAALQSSCEDGHTSLLEEQHHVCESMNMNLFIINIRINWRWQKEKLTYYIFHTVTL